MCLTLEKYFFTFFPTIKKPSETPEGDWLRCTSLISVFIHNGLFVFCLALVGFYPMIFNLAQACVSYSVYLTLREREIAVYIFLLCGQIATDALIIKNAEDGELVGMQMGGYIGNIVACCLLMFSAARAWQKFRATGGLHG